MVSLLAIGVGAVLGVGVVAATEGLARWRGGRGTASKAPPKGKLPPKGKMPPKAKLPKGYQRREPAGDDDSPAGDGGVTKTTRCSLCHRPLHHDLYRLCDNGACGRPAHTRCVELMEECPRCQTSFSSQEHSVPTGSSA